MDSEDDLSDFERFHFRGHWDTDGTEMIAAIRKAAGNEPIPVKALPWFLFKLALLRRLQVATSTAWLYLFYGLALLTGGILMGHDLAGTPHAHFQGLTTSHILMGLLALLALVLKVLVDHRLILGRFTYLYPLTLAGLGLQLLFFTDSSTVAK